MTPVELTEGAGVVVALLGLAAQELGKRRTARRAALREAETDGEENVASWQGLNRSLVEERNTAKNEIKELQAAHRIEMQRVHDRHHQEITSMREQWDKQARETRETYEREIGVLTRDLASCRAEVTELHRDIYRLQNPGRQP